MSRVSQITWRTSVADHPTEDRSEDSEARNLGILGNPAPAQTGTDIRSASGPHRDGIGEAGSKKQRGFLGSHGCDALMVRAAVQTNAAIRTSPQSPSGQRSNHLDATVLARSSTVAWPRASAMSRHRPVVA
jgi:hypothetical protein